MPPKYKNKKHKKHIQKGKILFLFDSKICSDPPMINDESKKRRKEKPFYQIKADASKLNNKKKKQNH